MTKNPRTGTEVPQEAIFAALDSAIKKVHGRSWGWQPEEIIRWLREGGFEVVPVGLLEAEREKTDTVRGKLHEQRVGRVAAEARLSTLPDAFKATFDADGYVDGRAVLREQPAGLREALEAIASGGIDVPGRGRLGVDSFVREFAEQALAAASPEPARASENPEKPIFPGSTTTPPEDEHGRT